MTVENLPGNFVRVSPRVYDIFRKSCPGGVGVLLLPSDFIAVDRDYDNISQ